MTTITTQIPIYTGSWRDQIDDSRFCRVAISRGVPRGRAAGASGYKRFANLAPGAWFKSIADPIAWAARYSTEILAPLDPAEVVAALHALGNGRPPVLICWEVMGAASWCHRGLVSAWLHDTLALEVTELGGPGACGHQHPLLPYLLRR